MPYFTSSGFERMMTRIPRPMREDSNPVLPKSHLCHGCKRYGQGCVHPCHREVRQGAVVEVMG